MRQFLAGVDDRDLIPDEIWVIRINPQKRDAEPETLSDIEDRRNELAGNLSLHQELAFICKVNAWIDAYPNDFGAAKKRIGIHMITMSKERSDTLYPASKFDRDPTFVSGLRAHGEERGRAFLDRWRTATDAKLKSLCWPCAILDG